MSRDLICPQCKNALQFKENEYICLNCNSVYPIVDGIGCFSKKDDQGSGFKAETFEFLFKIERKHFWHTGRKEIIYQALKRSLQDKTENFKMLEIGCGNGIVLEYLDRKGINVEGSDISIDGLRFCQKRVKIPLYQSDASNTPFPAESYDVVGAFDILEHIEDDQFLLNEIYRICKKEGRIIITVPANNQLWNDFDVISGHKRRYSKKELVLKIEKAGFKIEKISFYMFFLFPLLWLIRRADIFRNQKKKRNPSELLEFKTVPLINGFFLTVLRLEKRLLTMVNLPFGSSLICVAKK